MSKFLQVGPCNVIFSQIRFIQPNNDWFSLRRLKTVEAKISEKLESSLDDINSVRPGALETVKGDMTIENVKVTYNLRKRTNLPRFVVQTRAPKKPRHVDDSICKYKDYGGTFERKNVVCAELVVVIRRLTASELAKQLGVCASQASQSTTSSYFTGETVVERPTTPHEKAAIRRLLDNKEQKKRQRMRSSSDSENVDSANDLPKPDKPDLRPHQKRPALASTTSQQVHRSESPVRTTICPPRSSQPQIDVAFSKIQVPRQVRMPASSSAPESKALPEDAKSKPRSARDPDAENDIPRTSHSSSSGNGHQSGRSSSRSRDRKGKQTSRVESHVPESKKTAEKQTTELQASRQKQSSEKESTQRSKSSRDHKSSKHSKDNRHGSHKESSSRSHRQDGKREKSSSGDNGSSSKRPKTDRSSAKPKKESHSTKDVKLKQLLSDCGIGDSDSGGEDGTSRKEEKMEAVRTSPDSTQMTVETKVKRESMDDFKDRRAAAAVSKKSSAGGKRVTFNGSLFGELDENEDPRSSPKVGSSAFPEPSQNVKPHASARSSASVKPGEPSAESSLWTLQEYDPASPLVPTDPPKSRAVSYNPTPVSNTPVEYTPTKPVGSNSVSECKAAPSGREDTYVPSTTRARIRTELPLYVPSAMPPLLKQEEKPKRREEYVPSSVASGSRATRGRYEEYVPEAVGSASRRHQTTIDYVPTPKKEAAAGDAPDSGSAALPLSEMPEAKYSTSNLNPEASGRTNSILEQEIRTASEVKDLEEKHLRYLFDKCLPEMDGIIKRKIESWRNADYRRGGKAKRNLTYKVYFSLFSPQQMRVISDLFIEEFVCNRRLDGDYLNQVLIPEFLIRVVSANKGTSHQESDSLMANTPFKTFNIPLN